MIGAAGPVPGGSEVKRLGQLQSAILRHLADAGRWQWAADVARAIHGAEPPRSFAVSVRRALRALESRGLVRVDQSGERTGPGDTGKRLACWLPGRHSTPDPLRRPGVADVEAFVVHLLREARPGDHADCAPGPARFVPWLEQRRRPGDVPYRWVVRRFLEHAASEWGWDRRAGSWPHALLNRAVRRLGARKEVIAFRYRPYKSDPRSRIAWVRLARPVA